MNTQITVFLLGLLLALGCNQPQQKEKVPAPAVNYDNNAAAVNYDSNAAAGKYIVTRGIKIYYETYGTGKPLLLIHGNGGSLANFRYQIPFFEKHYQVIAVDSRAQGKSLD